MSKYLLGIESKGNVTKSTVNEKKKKEMLEKFVFRSKARGETGGGQQVGFRKRKTLSTRRGFLRD